MYAMQLIYGRKRADEILHSLREKISKSGVKPVFSAILVGDDLASHIYVNLKEKAAASVGIVFHKILLPRDISQQELLQVIEKNNNDVTVSGILVQVPLPKHLDVQVVINAIDPAKDVDGFHPDTVQRFLQGDDVLSPVFPRAIAELIQSVDVSVQNKRAVVIGNSDIFGQMMLATLHRIGVTGEFVQRKTLLCAQAKVLSADIVITACGEANLVTGDMVKSGAIVIDGGIVKIGDKVVGDVDISSMQDKDVFVSSVPGGVGPVTIACLLDNVYQASLQ